MKTMWTKIWNHKKIVLILVSVIVIGCLGWWKMFSNKSASSQFQSSKAERGTIIETVTASGTVALTGRIPVTTGASGQVKKVLVKDGETVQANQALLELALDNVGQQKYSQLWSSYLSAKSSLDSAKTSLYTLQSDMLTKWKSYMDLSQNSTYSNSDTSPKTENRQLPQFMSPQDDWLATEAKYKNQQTVISQTEASLSNAWTNYQMALPTVSAPSAGKITDITLVPGMTISADGTTAVRVGTIVIDTLPVASVNISEIDVLKVKAGQKVTMTIDSIPDKTFTGELVGVNRTGSVSSGVTSYPATIQFDTAPDGIFPNMAVSANIVIDSKNDVLLIPSAAIQTQGADSVARVLRNNQEVLTPVEVGISSDTQSEIKSGLSVGDEVITGTAAIGTTSRSGTSVFGGGMGGNIFRAGGGGGGAVRR